MFIEYFQSLQQRCSTAMLVNDIILRDSLVTELDCILSTTEEAIQLLSTNEASTNEVSTNDLRMIRTVAREYYRQFQASILTSSIPSSGVSSVQVVMPQGRCGRPSI